MTAALDADGAEASGDSALVTALAKALLVLEMSLVRTRTDTVRLTGLVIDIRAYIIDLEQRLAAAGIASPNQPLLDIPTDLFQPILTSPFEDPDGPVQ